MIAFITLCYASFYILIFNKFKLLQKTTANISAFVGVGVVLIASIVFAWNTFAPTSSDARVVRYVIPIVPNVSGQVVEVSVTHLQEVEQGDLLFKIDPTPFQHQVDELAARVEQQEAERHLNRINLERSEELLERDSISQVDVDMWQARYDASVAAVAATRASLENARWQLDETQVRAPSAGYPANVQLRPGSFVTSMPVASAMAFVSHEQNEIISTFSQSAIRGIKVGDAAEAVFTNRPGEVFSGKVTNVGRTTGEAQLEASGTIETFSGTPATARWPVSVELDDEAVAVALPQGAGGTVAVYTNSGKAFHVISKVVLRMQAWTGYLTTP